MPVPVSVYDAVVPLPAGRVTARTHRRKALLFLVAGLGVVLCSSLLLDSTRAPVHTSLAAAPSPAGNSAPATQSPTVHSTSKSVSAGGGSAVVKDEAKLLGMLRDCSNFPCSDGALGNVLLMGFYGAILMYGSKMIADGSEMLMEVMDPGLIGGLLLPVLGAVPDGMIVIMSGLGSDPAVVQQRVMVGLGTLAGSTIMLLTIPWAASMYVARCDLGADGEAKDGVCNGFDWDKQGVTVNEEVPSCSKIMLLTSLLYLVIQIPAFAVHGTSDAAKYEYPWAVLGFVLCVLGLGAYCAYMVWWPDVQAHKFEEVRKRKLKETVVMRFAGALGKTVSFRKGSSDSNGALLNKDGAEKSVDIKHFASKWKVKAKEKAAARDAAESEPTMDLGAAVAQVEEEGTEEEPEKNKVLVKAFGTMLAGTALVTVFSDPMVTSIDNLSEATHMSSFIVSFIVTPFASNASELISSLIFAAKKNKSNSSVTFSQLCGAASMNNTFVLAIFLGLVAFQGLTWSFHAEVITILVVTWVVGYFSCQRSTYKMSMAIPVALMYPASLILIAVLKQSFGLN